MAELTKQEITELALKELAEHDLTYVVFKWSNDRSRFGCLKSRYDRDMQEYLPRELSLSAVLFDALEDKWAMVDTLYHELAHAVAVKRHGRAGTGHGHLWKRVAVELGCDPTACKDAKIDNAVANYKYEAFCRNDCMDNYGFSRLGSSWKNNFYSRAGHKYICRHCRQPLLVRQNY